MKKAIIRNRYTGVEVKVHATTHHPSSKIGIPVWVDDDNNFYCEMGNCPERFILFVDR